MSLFVRCPNCAKDYRLGDEFARRKVRCQCGQQFLIDVPPPEPEEEPVASLLELVDDADRHATEQVERASPVASDLVQVQGTEAASSVERQLLDRLRRVAEQDIVRVFGTRAASCRLLILCEVCRRDLTGAALTFKLRGQFGGRTVKRTIRGVKQSVVATGIAHGLGGAAGLIVARGIERPLGEGDRISPQLEACFKGCLADVRLFIEEQGPRSASSEMDGYRYSKWGSFAVAGVMTLVATTTLHEQMNRALWIGAFLLGLLSGSMFGAGVYFYLLALMPATFFRNTPRGRWFVSKSGTSNLFLIRSGYVIMATLAILWALGVLEIKAVARFYHEDLAPLLR